MLHHWVHENFIAFQIINLYIEDIINQVTQNVKTFLVFVIILYLCSNIYAREDRKYERPGNLFSPLKIPLLEDLSEINGKNQKRY